VTQQVTTVLFRISLHYSKIKIENNQKLCLDKSKLTASLNQNYCRKQSPGERNHLQHQNKQLMKITCTSILLNE